MDLLEGDLNYKLHKGIKECKYIGSLETDPKKRKIGLEKCVEIFIAILIVCDSDRLWPIDRTVATAKMLDNLVT